MCGGGSMLWREGYDVDVGRVTRGERGFIGAISAGFMNPRAFAIIWFIMTMPN